MKVLVTGAAGFIGSALAHYLFERGDQVVGIDNLNDHYDVKLKRSRLERLSGYPEFVDLRFDIENADVDALAEDVRYKPSTSVEVGISKFVEWYRDCYGV